LFPVQIENALTASSSIRKAAVVAVLDAKFGEAHIIHAMNQLLANPTAPETASSLRAALKVWHYILKFIDHGTGIAHSGVCQRDRDRQGKDCQLHSRNPIRDLDVFFNLEPA
jgi:hypothetical protein